MKHSKCFSKIRGAGAAAVRAGDPVDAAAGRGSGQRGDRAAVPPRRIRPVQELPPSAR